MTKTSKESAHHRDQGPAEQSPVTYNSYLKIDKLKELQVYLSDPPHHDEALFIIIHQSYELWFKLILHELDTVASLIKTENVRKATFYMKRVNTILRLLVQQIHILETMSPQDFLGFRYNLSPASGFQSSQFRELEFTGGLKSMEILEHFKSDQGAYVALVKRYQNPSLGELFYALLTKHGFNMNGTNQEARIKELVKIYENETKYGGFLDLIESFIEFDEQVYLWRTHHVTVVERMIGYKTGTGGSEGVPYLRSTLAKRFFPDFWQLRTYLQNHDTPQTCPFGKN